MSKPDAPRREEAEIPGDNRPLQRRNITPVEAEHGLVSASINVENTGPQLEASVTRDPVTGGGYTEFVTFDVKGGGVDFSFSLSPQDARAFADELLEAVDETIPSNPEGGDK